MKNETVNVPGPYWVKHTATEALVCGRNGKIIARLPEALSAQAVELVHILKDKHTRDTGFTAFAFSRATTRAIAKYGRDVCVAAFMEWNAGNGANTVSWTVAGLKGGCTKQADAAINAGRELSRRAV